MQQTVKPRAAAFLVKALHQQGADMRLPEPGRREFVAVGNEQQQGELPLAPDDEVDELERGGVEPVRVVDRHQYWLSPGEARDQGHDGI